MTEEWRPVVGFEDDYEVSSLGRVRSLTRTKAYTRPGRGGQMVEVRRTHQGRLLRPGRQGSGHLSVCLGRGNTTLVHRMVLEAFVGPCPEGFEGLHGDDTPANNVLDNLRWGTRSDNLHDAVRNGNKPIGSAAFNAKLSEADIPRIRALTGRGAVAAFARSRGVNESTVRQVVSGKAWKHVASAT